MGRLMQEKWPWIEGTHALCAGLLDGLSDEELQFSPGGENMSLGALIHEMGDVEYSYIQSLRTFEQDWSYHNTEAGLQEHVAQLKKWFQTLDEEMKAAIEGLSDEDINREVKRGEFGMPVALQIDVYLQALLIFLGKATIYFKAMNKPLPKPVQEWIG